MTGSVYGSVCCSAEVREVELPISGIEKRSTLCKDSKSYTLMETFGHDGLFCTWKKFPQAPYFWRKSKEGGLEMVVARFPRHLSPPSCD